MTVEQADTYLVRKKVSYEPDLLAIKALIEQTGEIPDGIEFEVGPDGIVIE
jgi:hypothetical protein